VAFPCAFKVFIETAAGTMRFQLPSKRTRVRDSARSGDGPSGFSLVQRSFRLWFRIWQLHSGRR
jgi:hypothetical protein